MILRRNRVLGFGLLAGGLAEVSHYSVIELGGKYFDDDVNASNPRAEYLIELSFASLANRSAT